MKLIVGDVAYIQKFVMAFIHNEFYAAPGALYADYMLRYGGLSIRGAADAVQFSIKFENPDVVAFIKGCPYLLDFTKYSNMSVRALQREKNKLYNGISKRGAEFDCKDSKYQHDHEVEMREDFDQTRLMWESLNMLIACKKGTIPMPHLPEGADSDLINTNLSFGGHLRTLFSK